MSPTNKAAIQNQPGEKLQVASSPYIAPGDDQLIIKPHAWAINPLDTKLQQFAAFPSLQYPIIPGLDVAGEVFEVGSAVTAFKPGDRVLGIPDDISMTSFQAGYQEYVVAPVTLVSKIPDDMPFSDAVVFPLALATASCGLFQKAFLGLDVPTSPARPNNGKRVLVWGGASGVGGNAIQLARAAGYTVITTASTKNFEYVKGLGAGAVFDYNSPTVVEDIVGAITSSETEFAGILHTAGSMDASFDIADKISPDSVFIATSVRGPPTTPAGNQVKMVFGTTLKGNEVGAAVFGAFLPEALKKGEYQVAPQPLVVSNKGLEGIQEGYEVYKKGVSARKIVVLAE